MSDMFNNNRRERMKQVNDMIAERDQKNDWFFDQFDKTEARIEKIWKWAPIIWAVGFGLSAAVAITIIWAIIKIVSALT